MTAGPGWGKTPPWLGPHKFAEARGAIVEDARLRWLNWIFNLFEPEGDRDGAKNEQVMAKLGEQVREYVKGLPLRPGTTPLRLVPSYEHLAHRGHVAR